MRGQSPIAFPYHEFFRPRAEVYVLEHFRYFCSAAMAGDVPEVRTGPVIACETGFFESTFVICVVVDLITGDQIVFGGNIPIKSQGCFLQSP